jgi:uroporphyrinogen decarboxylase
MPLTPLERVQKTVKLQEPDVVPVMPFMGNHGAKIAGALLNEYCTNPEIMASSQLKAWGIYRQDAVVAQSDNYYIAEGFGVETEIRHDSLPTVKKTVIDDITEVDKLKIPDPYKDGRMPVYLEAINILSDKLKNEGVCVRAPGTGPFSLASHLMGIENFLVQLAMAEGDEYRTACFKKLMDLTSDSLIAFAKASLCSGANFVMCGDSLASINVISPKMYQEWAFPYEKKFFDAIKTESKKYGCFSILHICGNMTKVLELMADTGADILEIDTDVSLSMAKQRVGDKVCLLGNIHPTKILLQGSVQDVNNSCDQAIKDAGKGGGFILGSGCEVPPFAPQENIKAMINSARQSFYPL